MKRIVIIFFLLFIACVERIEIINIPKGKTLEAVATYYVATTGNNGNAGTIGSPWATIQYGVGQMSAGDVLYIRGGTYSPSGTVTEGEQCGVGINYKTGTLANPYSIFAYPGETVILSGTNVTSTSYSHIGIGIFNSAYVYVMGINVTNFIQNSGGEGQGIYISYSPNCQVVRCTAHGIGGVGMGSRGNIGILRFTNCDSYNNWDQLTTEPSGPNYDGGGDADGYDVGFSNGTIIFTGCRAWDCSDDGFDCFNNHGYASVVYHYNCWAFGMGWKGSNHAGIAGDGNGFKPGLQYVEGTNGRYYYNCIAYGNRLSGYNQNEATCRQNVYNCISYLNGDYGFNFYSTNNLNVLQNNVAWGNSSGSLNYVGTPATNTNNSWNLGLAITAADFQSVTASQLSGPRQADGSLPIITFLTPNSTSDLLAKGVVIPSNPTDGAGNPWAATPAIGAYEYISAIPADTTQPVYKERFIYRGYTPTDLKSRAVIPNAADIQRTPTSIRCGNITATKIATALGVTTHKMHELCTNAAVNKWSAFSPYTRSVAGGLLVHNLPTDDLAGDFAGYHHTATAPHFDSVTHDDEIWIVPGEIVHFSPTVNIGELKYIGGDITGHSDCVGIALTVWDGASLRASDVMDLSDETDVIYPDATLTGGASDVNYTCKLYLVSSLLSFDFTLADVVCQITELANYTKSVRVKQGSGASLSAPPGWVISGTPLNLNTTNGTIVFQGLHNASYSGHLTVSAYVTNWLGVVVTDTTILWTGTYSGDLGITIGNTVIWKVGGVTQSLPIPPYGYTATVYVNPV